MISPDRLRRPFGTLLASELRVVGLALSREAALAAAGLALLCFLVAATAIRYGERLDAMPELLLAVMPVAAILPWLVWKGDPPSAAPFCGPSRCAASRPPWPGRSPAPSG